jgi:hypothetical protein
VGKNAQAYPELIEELKKEGHCIGNHTFSHEKGWKTGRKSYLRSVDATGKISRIEKSVLSEYRVSQRSLMPEGFEQLLNPEELAAVVSFLRSESQDRR